jgi:hypothetical protein
MAEDSKRVKVKVYGAELTVDEADVEGLTAHGGTVVGGGEDTVKTPEPTPEATASKPPVKATAATASATEKNTKKGG